MFSIYLKEIEPHSRVEGYAFNYHRLPEGHDKGLEVGLVAVIS